MSRLPQWFVARVSSPLLKRGKGFPLLGRGRPGYVAEWLLVIFLCFAVTASAFGAVGPLVTCGDFETGGGVSAPGWTIPTNGQWQVVKGGGLNGNAGLVWRSETPAPKGAGVQQEIAFRAGVRYGVEAFVRTKLASAVAPRPGAGVYLMWFDKKGKMLGQCWPNKVRLTTDWTHAVGTTKTALPPETARLVVGLFVQAGSTGEAAFDEVAVSEYVEQQITGPESVRYRYANGAGASGRVHIDGRNRFVVNGKPFFPLGLSCQGYEAASDALLAKYTEAPFNMISLPYFRPNREQLDNFAKHRLMVLYPVRCFFHGGKRAPKEIRSVADELPVLKAALDPVKDHPAILGWNVADEASPSFVPRLAARRDWLETYDPDHPVFGVFNRVDAIRAYLPAVDVLGTDIYPIGSRSASAAGDETVLTREGTFGQRALMQVMQCFAWEDITYMKRPGRFPTREELRAMAWQMIAAGANGLYGFAFNMMVDLKTLEPRNGGWEDCKVVAKEIAAAFPILLAGDDPPALEGVPSTLLARTYRDGDKAWLLVCNRTERPVTEQVNVVGFEAVSVSLPPLGVSLRPTRRVGPTRYDGVDLVK